MCKRILAVDDDPAILSVLRDLLEYAGYEISTLSHGDIIFEAIKQFSPDLILLDVMLGGMDGRDICRAIKLKFETHNIPVILISATHNLADSLNQEGAPNDFVPKPFDIYLLLDKIEEQLAA
jgi:DNA-binding response OmpR family regulator